MMAGQGEVDELFIAHKLLHSFCVVFFFFWAAVSAFALLSRSIVLFTAHFKLFY